MNYNIKKSKKCLALFLSLLSLVTMLSFCITETYAVTPSYNVSSYYASSIFYQNLCSVKLTGDQRHDILEVAKSQLGYREGSQTSDIDGYNDLYAAGKSHNYTEYNYWYYNGMAGGDPYAWCAVFVSWCARQAQIPTSILKNSSCAGCSESYFNITCYSGNSYTPQPGDLFFTSTFSHVGLVAEVGDGYFWTIEGNSNSYGTSDGDGVYYNMRTGLENYYFGVPNYQNNPSPSNPGNSFYAYVKNPATSFCLTGSNQELYMSDLTNSNTQVWKFDRQEDASYAITTKGGCLEVSGNTLTLNSNGFSNKSNQRFFLYYLYGGYYICPVSSPAYAIEANSQYGTLSLQKRTEKNHSQEFSLLSAEYDVNFDFNGGVGVIAPMKKSHGYDLTLPSTVPVKTGYDFLYWSTAKDGSGATYQAGDSYNIDGNSTLFAIWSPKDIKLIVTPPTKTEYFLNDEFDSTGLHIEMENYEQQLRDVTEQCTLSGYDMSVSGKQKVTVTCGDITSSFEINVIEPHVELPYEQLNVSVGTQIPIAVSAIPEPLFITWISSDESVAVIDGNTLKAVGPGQSMIIAVATYDDKMLSNYFCVNVFKTSDNYESIYLSSLPKNNFYNNASEITTDGIEITMFTVNGEKIVSNSDITIKNINTINDAFEITYNYANKYDFKVIAAKIPTETTEIPNLIATVNEAELLYEEHILGNEYDTDSSINFISAYINAITLLESNNVEEQNKAAILLKSAIQLLKPNEGKYNVSQIKFILKKNEATPLIFDQSTLYAKYLNCVKDVVEETDKDYLSYFINMCNKSLESYGGDYDHNGVITANDALSVLQVTIGKKLSTPLVRILCDMDNDNIITVSDTLMILQKSVGKIQ